MDADFVRRCHVLRVAYTLQIVGQKGMNPTVASLILSMESVISVIAGWLILHQTLSTKELMGCELMFAAIILVQLPDRAKNNEYIQSKLAFYIRRCFAGDIYI